MAHLAVGARVEMSAGLGLAAASEALVGVIVGEKETEKGSISAMATNLFASKSIHSYNPGSTTSLQFRALTQESVASSSIPVFLVFVFIVVVVVVVM